MYRGKDPGKTAWLVLAGLVAFMFVLAGCGSSDSSAGPQELGKREGKLSLVSLPEYLELGWTVPFQEATGCKVERTAAKGPKDMLELMRTGRYDGVAAPSYVSARLVAEDSVAPINVDLIPHYETIFDDLKDLPINTFDDQHYGIPLGRGANILIWSDRAVSPPPSSWDVMLDPAKASKYKGRISVYDSPMYIADAALYLKAHQPELGIENIYQLNDEQFRAALDLVKKQKPNVGEYWSEAGAQFNDSRVELGSTWLYQYLLLNNGVSPVATNSASEGYLPEEGATGWSTSWMIGEEAEHPNCMYAWMNWIVSPLTNAQVAEWIGMAPSQTLACEKTQSADFCADYHAEDPAFWERVDYWEAPLADCGDGSEGCKDYEDWVDAWVALRKG